MTGLARSWPQELEGERCGVLSPADVGAEILGVGPGQVDARLDCERRGRRWIRATPAQREVGRARLELAAMEADPIARKGGSGPARGRDRRGGFVVSATVAEPLVRGRASVIEPGAIVRIVGVRGARYRYAGTETTGAGHRFAVLVPVPGTRAGSRYVDCDRVRRAS